MRKKIVRISAIIGIILFGFLVYKIGPEKIWININRISFVNFIYLFLLRILYWLLRTLNWKIVLKKLGENLSLSHLFLARMSGHSVGQLTPSAQMGSEATRILIADCSNRRLCIASSIIDKTIEFFAIVFFTLIGTFIAFIHIKLPKDIKITFSAGILLITFVILFVFFKQKKGILTWIFNLTKKLGLRIKFLEKNAEKIAETDKYISDFYKKNPSGFFKVFFLYSLMILLWVTEIHLTIFFLGIKDINFITSFIITTIGNLAFVFPFIPGSLGIYEATYIAIMAIVKQKPDIAIALVLIRRILALTLAGLGLIGMFKLSKKKEKSDLAILDQINKK